MKVIFAVLVLLVAHDIAEGNDCQQQGLSLLDDGGHVGFVDRNIKLAKNTCDPLVQIANQQNKLGDTVLEYWDSYKRAAGEGAKKSLFDKIQDGRQKMMGLIKEFIKTGKSCVKDDAKKKKIEKNCNEAKKRNIKADEDLAKC